MNTKPNSFILEFEKQPIHSIMMAGILAYITAGFLHRHHYFVEYLEQEDFLSASTALWHPILSIK